MSTLTPHHVGLTTLTFHLASLLYTIWKENNTLFDTATLPQWYSVCMLLLPAQHNEQQPGLQFAVIQESHLSSFAICLPRIPLPVPASTSTFCA
ncbi:hypothetical protein VN97_g1367 [Penicillium thymicola]|uniref:Uncharacterized protein n=1 Tax=Penicillium thymicola TaxID=293382 RepID=A0AAI9TR48_PENTH|nr:hypothetical protein VN97_g1367 [Penicillium thymicola]